MRKYYLGFAMLIILVSCGHKNSSTTDISDSIYGESIHIDESTRLSPDTTVTKDTVAVLPEKKFTSATELKEYLKNSPNSKDYMQGIIPRIADYSLEYAQKLVNNTHDGFIIVDKSRMKVVLLDKYGREKLSYGMACAKKFGNKHKKADSRTPEGFFTAGGIYDSTDWLFTDDEGKTSKVKGQFGPRFIRLKCPSTSQIGIHGTVAPWSIGHRVSHGCIRVTNENILELVKHVTVGMPIIVVPGKRDIQVNNEEGYKSVWIPSTLDADEPKAKKLDDEQLRKNREEFANKEKEKAEKEEKEKERLKAEADSAAMAATTKELVKQADSPEGTSKEKESDVSEISAEETAE